MKNEEFIYLNIASYGSEFIDMNAVVDFHERETKQAHPEAIFHYTSSISRKDGRTTKLRTILRKETHLHEYTGFVDFESFCVFCVLFTPEELQIKNIRKLEYLIERVVPININLISSACTEIATLENYLSTAEKDQDKAEILIRIAKIYCEIEDHEKATEMYQQSVAIFPENFGARLALLELGMGSENSAMLTEAFFNLGPGERAIYNELIRVYSERNRAQLLHQYLLNKLKETILPLEVKGQLLYALGELSIDVNTSEALGHFLESQKCLKQCFSAKHDALKSLKKIIRTLSNYNKRFENRHE
ncbi:MAG TPA: hypothetical protein VK826_16395 [Bacteroidia bacterium]|nr:hypothetical protein [Bacteroidia bacterium]